MESYPTNVVFKEEQYFKAYWPFQAFGKPKKVTKGERNNTVTCFINNLRILNPTKQAMVTNLVKAYNKEYCSPSLPEKEIEEMVSYAYSRECNPIGVRTKRIWVNPDIKDKRQAIGKAKAESSKGKIEEYLSIALCENEKITPTKIIKATGLCRATVYKYLALYNEEINDFNESLKITKQSWKK